ncbi:MAG: MEDS domain-containing protein [Candidatus Aminicenantes bacterium]|nr:MEDS domain-containing protein [Candidatus Aminicenantes bacterium]
MCSKGKEVHLGFTGETFPPGIHMCYIYNDEAQRKNVISKFLESGLLSGEKTSYFMDVITIDEMNEYFSTLGLDRLLREHEGRFSVATTKDTYYPSDTFVPDEMLDRLGVFYTRSIQEGYTGARMSGEMSWAVRNIPGCSRLIEYEARVNDVLLTYPVNTICQYNARLFDGALLFDVLSVHPMMIVHGQIVKNPYYIKPEEFLKDYSARKQE